MAKAVTSAYVPLGALTVPEEVYQALVEASGKHGVLAHGFTYSGHPLACAVALKTIEIYERIDIVGHVQRVAPIFQLRLKALADHPLVGEARGVGLIGALELMRDKKAKQSFESKLGVGAKATRFAEEEGLICRAVGGDSVALCPPLIIDGAEINAMFDALGRALDRTEPGRRPRGTSPDRCHPRACPDVRRSHSRSEPCTAIPLMPGVAAPGSRIRPRLTSEGWSTTYFARCETFLTTV